MYNKSETELENPYKDNNYKKQNDNCKKRDDNSSEETFNVKYLNT